MNRLNLLLIALMMFAITCSLAAAAFEVIDMSATQITLKFTLPEIEYRDVVHEGVTYQDVRVNGSLLYGEEGYPRLPYFAEMIGLPVNGSYSLQLVRQKTETVTGVTPVPVEKFIPDEENPGTEFYRNNLAYASKSPYPATILEKGNEGFMGDHRFAGVIFNPVRYKASSNELYITKEAVVRINISGDTTPSRNWELYNRNSSSMVDKLFINNQYAKKWTKQREKAEHYQSHRSNAVDELQIVVDEDGIYRINYSDLADSLASYQDSLGFSTTLQWETLDPRYLSLSNEYGPVPIYISGENDGSFDEDDFIEFYGERHAGDEGYFDEYTEENVYTLKIGSELGARMAVENGGLVVYDEDDYIVPQSYEQTVHVEQQNGFARLGFYNEDYREDMWVWRSILAPNLDIVPFELQYPHMSTTRAFHASVMLIGNSHPTDVNPDHHAVVRINSTMIGTEWWDGQKEQLFEDDRFLANSFLNHGENYLYISLAGDTGAKQEQVSLDYLELTYWRLYQTDEDFIRFTKPSNKPFGTYQFEIGGFASDDISVYKIGSSLMENPSIEPFSETGEAPYTLKFQDDIQENGIEYFAVANSEKKKAKFIHPNIPSNLKSPDHFANYVIITPSKFVENEGTQLLKSVWEQYGYSLYNMPVSVEIVAVEDIFDEFNHGIRSAESIKDFLRYAYNNWNLPENGGTNGLTHALLLGEGTFDERDDSSYRHYNMVPVKLLWTEQYGATASDNWYGCFIGDDGVPEIHIGRLNVWQPQQVIDVAEKTRDYIENPDYDNMWHSRLIYAAGGKIKDSDDRFATQSEGIINTFVPERFEANRVYTVTKTVPQEFFGGTIVLKDYLEQGALFLQFMGHGGGRIWADYDLLNSSDVVSLTNGNYPFVSSMACYCSAFDTGGMVSISEVFTMTPGSGAIGHVGFSGYGYLSADLSFSQYLNDGLFNKGIMNTGELITYVKSKMWANTTYASSTRYAMTYGAVLSGDPMIKLNVPAREVDVTLDDYTPSEGDVIQITANMGTDIVAATFQIFDEEDVRLNVPFPAVVNNGVFQASYAVPPNSSNMYQRTVKVVGYGVNGEASGVTHFSVGKSAIANRELVPELPTEADDVEIRANFFDEQGVAQVQCNWFGGQQSGQEQMTYSSSDAIWKTENKLPAMATNTTVIYTFTIVDSEGDSLVSEQYSYKVAGPDLRLLGIENGELNHAPSLQVLIRNNGQIKAPEASVKLYQDVGVSHRLILLATSWSPEIEPEGQEFVDLKLPMESGTFKYVVAVNEEKSFTESEYVENESSFYYTMNPFMLTFDNLTAGTLDGNMEVQIPNGVFPDSTVGSFGIVEDIDVLSMPDIENVTMRDSLASKAYKIYLFNDELLADSTGTLPGNAKMKLSFKYAGGDPVNMQREGENRFHVYRWEDDYKKWVNVGGMTSVTDNRVMAEVNRMGTYCLFYNGDTTIPQIEANVEDQEFTQGGYISGKGVISFTCADANGIDVFDHPIKLYLDGQQLPASAYTLTAVSGNLNSVPLKYPLDLEQGSYTLLISCSDLNGNYNERTIPFKVNTEFDVINVANYPNPVISNAVHRDNVGRTRFTYVLTDDADDVKIKIYTVSGRLVKTFQNLPTSVGYHEYPRTTKGWDCRDNDEEYLANGVYFYKFIAKKGSKKIEKTCKMAILK